MRFFRSVLFVYLLRHEKQSAAVSTINRTWRVHSGRIRIFQAPGSREMDHCRDWSGHTDNHRIVDGSMESRQVDNSDRRSSGRKVFLVCVHRGRGDVRPRANRQLRRIRI